MTAMDIIRASRDKIRHSRRVVDADLEPQTAQMEKGGSDRDRGSSRRPDRSEKKKDMQASRHGTIMEESQISVRKVRNYEAPPPPLPRERERGLPPISPKIETETNSSGMELNGVSKSHSRSASNDLRMGKTADKDSHPQLRRAPVNRTRAHSLKDANDSLSVRRVTRKPLPPSGDCETGMAISVAKGTKRPQHDERDESLVFSRTCSLLMNFIERYRSNASQIYSGDPESFSVMLLTIMELWVACDLSATKLFPLLRDYETGFPCGVLDALVLTKKNLLDRLAKVEDYLAGRKSGARFGPTWENGLRFKSSFAVRFFAGSTEHQTMYQDIIERATALRDQKLKELRSSKQEYNRLMQEHIETPHLLKKALNSWGDWVSQDSPDCPSCTASSRARSMNIQIFEWPLPDDETEAKAAVFELQVPEVILAWRHATLTILLDALGRSQKNGRDHSGLYYPQYDEVLRNVLESKPSREGRFRLASAGRAIVVHHDGKKPISEATEENVCIRNGCWYDLYDTQLNENIPDLLKGLHAPHHCSYPPPTVSEPLKGWILNTSHSVNDAIARQIDCPPTMALEEYKAFGNLRGGVRVQWQNILSQLTIPTLNFNKPETFFLILQAANQAGPRPREGWTRDAHEVLGREPFGKALLGGLRDALARIKGNWESDIALCIFLSLATRLLSASSSNAVQRQCLDYLSEIRRISIHWARNLIEKLSKSSVIDERRDLNHRVLMMALICHGSFDIGASYLPLVLKDPTEASLFIESSMIVADHHSCHGFSPDPILTIFLNRWRRLSYEAEIPLRHEIVWEANSCLDTAIKNSWPAYSPGTEWAIVASPHQHLLIADSSSTPGRKAVRLQYNILTGSLLVNGSPPSTLPSTYQTHGTYQRLFRDQIINVRPSTMERMSFSATGSHYGHEVHFGMFEDDLIIRTHKGGKTYELIPTSKLQGDFPTLIISNYAHWLVVGEEKIEFRPLANAWKTSEDWDPTEGFILDFTGDWALLVKNGSGALIDVQSKTAKMISEILRPLEKHNFIQLTFNVTQSLLDIELPRLRISFGLGSGDTVIRSNQFRSFIIDTDQCLGTLSGLENKLVLRPVGQISDLSPRAVIIPHGEVSFTKGETGHASAKIADSEEGDVGYHFYKIDSRLGRLKDSGALQSKLFLCLLHAFTSHCLPDKLTRRTGTEEALRLLDSAAMRSFDRLSIDDIALLRRIAAISPKREFYPESKKYMQRVTWSHLSPLAQDDSFYDIVQSILIQAQDCELFYPQSRKEIEPLSHSTEELNKRHVIKASGYRTSQFGAEQHTTEYDKDYASRDTVAKSDAEQRMYRLANFLGDGRQSHLLDRPSPSTVENISNILGSIVRKTDPQPRSGGADVSARSARLKISYSSKAEFDVAWLQSPSTTLANTWFGIRKQLCESDMGRDKYKILMFLAALTFCDDADPQIVQVLLDGAVLDQAELKRIAEECKTGFHVSAESRLPRQHGEQEHQFNTRRQHAYDKRLCDVIDDFVFDLQSQGLCEDPPTPTSPDYAQYLNVDALMGRVKSLFASWYRNDQLHKDIQNVVKTARALPICQEYQERFPKVKPAEVRHSDEGYLEVRDLFLQAPPPISLCQPRRFQEYLGKKSGVEQPERNMEALLSNLEGVCKLQHERQYVTELRQSLKSLKGEAPSAALYSMRRPVQNLKRILRAYLEMCQHEADDIYAEICDVLKQTPVTAAQIAAGSLTGPRVSPILLLELLSERKSEGLNEEWEESLVAYALSITTLQRAERLLKAVDNEKALIKELTNSGHSNWSPMEFKESLLLEVENGILIRPVQEEIAAKMRQPPFTKNAVMQLNMGEGKSSVIVPIVAAALADGSKLVRVVVTKPLSKQMMHILTMKLGGLLNRRVYYLPFSRDLRPSEADAQKIMAMCKQIMENGHILLAQPEHILSFKLLGLENLLSGKESIGRTLLETQDFFDNFSRDIVDECDENFSVKFELTYTMGSQNAIEYSPHRWVLAQQVLALVEKAASHIQKQYPGSLELDNKHIGGFPRIKFLNESVGPAFIAEVAQRICDRGLEGFSNVSRQTTRVRKAILKYIVDPNPSPSDIRDIENPEARSFTESMRQPLLLLRGLLAGGTLLFSLEQKRWRVNYGLDPSRNPPTGLAVPYRAKDSPALRSEFSHPDVVILLTCLSYYYGGLKDSELFTTFGHIFTSDQGDSEYSNWVRSVPEKELPHAYRHLSGVNIKDRTRCIEEIFPRLRYVKSVIDYYLSKILFPREIREFTKKLSASGWDIAKAKRHPTTGFSGTTDSKYLLPLSIEHLDLAEQQHTNALVLNYLLRSENSVKEIYPEDAQGQARQSVAEFLLRTVVQSTPKIQVILDVGAQILELENLDVAKTWLAMVPLSEADAAIFFNDKDELSVVTRNGLVQSFVTSPYSTQIASCLVFLDEAHTRGTDLELPDDYRAAVTTGPKLTKDRLVQACMRMRKLGKGQSLVFYVPEEIRRKISKLRNIPKGRPIETVDVLMWSVCETWDEFHKSIPLWARQGIRHQRQEVVWKQTKTHMHPSIAEKYLEDDGQTLEQRYTPSNNSVNGIVSSELRDATLREKRKELQQIQTRCTEFGVTNLNSSAFQEEQERELSTEIEEESQIKKPTRMDAHTPSLHPDVTRFVNTGDINSDSSGFRPAFLALRDSSVANLIDLNQFSSDLLVTEDFVRTVEPGKLRYISDQYQRSVQWIVTSLTETRGRRTVKHMVIFSQWEVNQLYPTICSGQSVTLHMYSPRPNLTFRSLEDLTLYTSPSLPEDWSVPRKHILQLNLFAGQLYLRSYEEYTQLCDFLGLSYQANNSNEARMGADGFVGRTRANPNCIFTKSPVPFLNVLVTKIRRDCQDIGKTDMGRILSGELLGPEDFVGRNS
ncbi:hypothetical protein K432DRAFT_429141 [Lepidopterella palustris CBS 459.81]|uniref:ubiquitinyl hydrolase 1 n=1 Tax=Lepidopterella palustris CBS 459.81 TaxID=1314670 RepID=A0A8E2E288_9PEZI|nr:hypothetical protein K432DRAFT_429141 [Lepidopterella palustris CBS 459.81]